MCTVILIAVPREADLDEVGAALGCAVDPVVAVSSVSSVSSAWPGDLKLVRRRRACDCGTQLGCGEDDAEPSDFEGERKRLRRKGWSEAKVARWLADKRRAEQRLRRDRLAHAERGEDVDTWRTRLARLAPGEPGPVGVLITDTDWLEADQTRGALPSVDHGPLAEVESRALLGLEHGKLHLFERSA